MRVTFVLEFFSIPDHIGFESVKLKSFVNIFYEKISFHVKVQFQYFERISYVRTNGIVS